MLKSSLLLLFLLVSAFGTLKAQTMSADSIKRLAQKDAQKFKLNKTDFQKFRKDRKNSKADFFKPSSTYTPSITLLTDSVYVSAFREFAYQKSRKRRTGAHYVLVGGIVYGLAIAIITIPVSATH